MEPTKTTIIANNLNKEAIFNDILREKNGVIDIEVLPFSAWLAQDQTPNDPTLEMINCYNALQKIIDQFEILDKAMIYPAFVQEFIAFVHELNEYGIAIEQLPASSVLDQEIKTIAGIIKNNMNNYPSVKTLCLNKGKLNNTYLYPTYHRDLIYKQAYDILLANGAKQYQSANHKPNIVHLFRALNKRQEIEGLAQYLINENIELSDVLICLANPNDYQKWLDLVFKRYHIPYVSSFADSDLVMIQRYRKLIKLITQPTTIDLIDCLNNDCFSKPYRELSLYLKQFNVSFAECLTSFTHELPAVQHIINRYELAKINELINSAISDQQELLETLTQIATCDKRVKSIAILAYDILISKENDPNELPQIYLIKQFLEDYLDHIDSFLLFDQLLSELMIKPQPTVTDQLLVTSLSEALGIRRKYQFVLGADSSAYPQINYHNGILDEQYYATLDYPSKDERYRFYLEQLEACFGYCDKLFISYAYGDFSGKSKKIAFELDTFIKTYTDKKFCEWPIVENDEIPYDTHNLAPNLSKQLFFDDHVLHGSVSSFESYFNCPYQYFVQHGLKIDTYDIELNSAKLGTVLHYIMQSLVNKYQKDYAKATEEQVIAIIDQAFDPLNTIYPNHLDLISVFKHNFYKMIVRQLQILDKIERNDQFVPLKAEHPFHSDLTYGNVTINLNGIIDRIDVTDDQYRIIDYKSSNHNLEKKKVANGQQLQLLTYLWLMKTELAKTAEGAYYCNFTSTDTTVAPVKLDRRRNELQALDDSDWYELYYKKHQLSGWSFALESENKKQLSFDQVKDILSANYQKLAAELLAGIIKPKPQEGACEYCEFLSICRYYQKTDDDESEDDNDEME